MPTDVDALSVDQLWPACCLAHMVCPGSCINGEQPMTLCQTCIGKGPKPGRVWALPGMQERCPHTLTACHTTAWLLANPGKRCEPCSGTGWVAKRDLGALLAAGAEPGHYAISLVALDAKRPDGFRFRAWCRGYQGDGFEPTVACLRAVAQALVAQGAALGVTANG